MSSNTSVHFEESSDDGRFIRIHPLLQADKNEPEKITLTGFLDDLKDALADQDMLALMAVERDNISAKSANVHVKGVTSFEQTAADRVLVQRQVFNDVLKWRPLSAAQTRADVVLNFAEDGLSAQPSFEPIKQPKRKDYEKKLSKDSSNIAKELCGDNVDTTLKLAGLVPLDESDSENIKSKLSHEQDFLDAMTHQQEAHRSTAEIARLRSLLYYNEQKLKAWAKIKSKKFRKVHNRDKRLARLEKRQEEWKEKHRSSVMEQAEDFLDSQYRLTNSSLDAFQQQARRNTKADDEFEAHKVDVDDVPEYGEAPIDRNAKGVMRLAFMTKVLQEQRDTRDAIVNARDSDWNSTGDSDEDNGFVKSESQPRILRPDIAKNQALKAHLDMKEDDQQLESELVGEKEIIRKAQLAKVKETKTKGKIIIKGCNVANKSATVIDNPFLKRFSSSASALPAASNEIHIRDLPTIADESILPSVPRPGSIATSALTADVDPELEFAAQKYSLALQESQPVAPEKELLGWGTWFGEGMSIYDKEKLTFRQEAQRAAVTAELNRRMGRRRDIKVANVSISEASNPAIVELYAAHGIQGITDAEYATYLSTAVGPEWQSMTGYRGSIQAGRRVEKGRMILPAQLPQDYQKKMDASLEKEQKLRKQLEAQMQLIHKTKLTQQRRSLKL
ncbi:Hypothetical protein GLP15_206 [Giardia lamblia P15]|uniref:Utp14 protein n=1 Tax=Giardia intestinalis (strain P15) TaxID=658858 RepID=E1F1H7_GIAIA|nr:Hypothetical protein GLP15_206 [Giardia lamblia P15]